jgi:hypothetical protein
MMRAEIPFDKFSTQVFKAWGSDWFLLTSGSFKTGKFNAMTVAWGSFGVMWQKPKQFAQLQAGANEALDSGIRAPES